MRNPRIQGAAAVALEHSRPPSEDEVKRELNLASAADSLVHVAQTIRAVVEARVRASAGCRQCRCSNRGEAVADTVLRNVVERSVRAPLPGLAKILRCPVVKLVS